MSQMIIANRLTDGLVVFMTESGQWVESIADGHVIGSPTEAEQLFALSKTTERDCMVIDPCLIDVVEHEGVPKPTVYREEIRARGPSVRVEAG